MHWSGTQLYARHSCQRPACTLLCHITPGYMTLTLCHAQMLNIVPKVCVVQASQTQHASTDPYDFAALCKIVLVTAAFCRGPTNETAECTLALAVSDVHESKAGTSAFSHTCKLLLLPCNRVIYLSKSVYQNRLSSSTFTRKHIQAWLEMHSLFLYQSKIPAKSHSMILSRACENACMHAWAICWTGCREALPDDKGVHVC